VNDLPSEETIRREEQMGQQTNQRSAVTGPKPAKQNIKRKRVEEDILNISGNFRPMIAITEWY